MPTTSPNFTTPPGRAWSAKAPAREPPIDLDTMLDLTAAAEVDGVKFDGVDLFLFDPHVEHRRHATTSSRRWPTRPGRGTWSIGSVVAPVWPPTGGGSAMGERRGPQEVPRPGPQGLPHRPAAPRAGRPARTASCGSTRPAASSRLGRTTRRATQKRIAETFREACDIAEDHGERLAAEGEICWGGMHSWRRMLAAAGDGRPAARRSASRPTWPTRCSTCWATTRPEDAPPAGRISTGTTRPTFDAALQDS